jgi:HSP20 family protein
MSKAKKRSVQVLRDLALEPQIENGILIDHLAVGSWQPHVDVCETREKVLVRIELPGVDAADTNLTIEAGVVRITGVKRQPALSGNLVCFYCVERRYGRFEREIPIRCVVDIKGARASMRSGVLTLELPRMPERRGEAVRIPVIAEEN